ncbi:citramalate synthase [Humisphaera borealis]|uniref:Citramalate synthase n=1 Tax=Humisphaera borealis TaxID=2807512 RepID=A0A7M2WYX6_9BACT|nr:citramalate synthase [Humisphaera borealis]QOV90708.1 citramalate synthase [Humisphaera borealis]
MSRIEIYDTTLRDGTQGEGFNLSLQDKLAIAQKLDELGVDYIEGGFPLSNPKDAAFFRDVRELKLKHAKVAAFGMTRRRGIKAEDDPGMKALLEAETPVVTIVGKSSEFQVTKVLGVSLEENLKMIGDTVALMRSAGRQVVYDAEHFFDAYKANAEYAIRTLLAAQEAGASVLALCDTNGGSMPEHVARAVADVLKQTSARVGVHTHNDCGMAMANGLAGIAAGATHGQGTINGVGERCGNMDLLPFIANLRLKYGHDCLRADSLKHLTETSRYVYEIANMSPINGQPYVGASAFAHKGGMHVHAVQKDASTYEHVSPETVGNSRKVLVSEMSGQSNIAAKAGKKFDIESDKEVLRKVLGRVQDLENEGYQFEAAEASFELLLRKEIGRYRKYFELDHYRCVILRQNGSDPLSEATVKLHVGGDSQHQVAEGDGPVAALDGALRKALRAHYPQIDQVHLTDYKVRVINSKDETSAKVRVVIECKRNRSPGDGSTEGKKELFGTIGVSTNVIDASWQALVDAYEYHLVHVEEGAGQP